MTYYTKKEIEQRNKENNICMANVVIDGMQIYLGSFNTEQEAAECIKEFKNNLK